MINFQQIFFEFANYIERVLSLANEGPRFDRAVINATKRWMLDASEINDREAKSAPSIAMLCLRYAPMSLIMTLNGVLHSFTFSLGNCRTIADSTSFSPSEINGVEWAWSVASDISDEPDIDSGRVLPLLFTLGLTIEIFLSFYFFIFLISQPIVKTIYMVFAVVFFSMFYIMFFSILVYPVTLAITAVLYTVYRAALVLLNN